MTSRDELVTGHEKCVRDDEGRREGRSIFYTATSLLSKSTVELESYKQVNFPPYSSPPQDRQNEVVSSFESSRASVTSADVEMIENEQNTIVQRPLQVSQLSIELHAI